MGRRGIEEGREKKEERRGGRERSTLQVEVLEEIMCERIEEVSKDCQ